jgi:hypothetical protein
MSYGHTPIEYPSVGCGCDYNTVNSGWSLKKFAKGVSHGVSHAAHAVSKAAHVSDIAKQALRVANKATALALVPAALSTKALSYGFKKAGLGAVASLVEAPYKLATTVNDASANAAAAVIRGNPAALAQAVQAGIKQVSANPAFQAAMIGASFIPGPGQAIASGVATAMALGSGASLKDAALAAAKAALPGGPLAAAAFDVGVGLAKGQNLSEAAILALRERAPGPLGKAAFDAGLLIARRKAMTPDMFNIAKNALPPEAQAAFGNTLNAAQTALNAVKNPSGIANAYAQNVAQQAQQMAVTKLEQEGARLNAEGLSFGVGAAYRNRQDIYNWQDYGNPNLVVDAWRALTASGDTLPFGAYNTRIPAHLGGYYTGPAFLEEIVMAINWKAVAKKKASQVKQLLELSDKLDNELYKCHGELQQARTKARKTTAKKRSR